MPNKNPGSVYKRFETDDEYKTRILAKYPTYEYDLSYRFGSGLDLFGEQIDVQRRIVEDEA
jgi:hypothetical protein